MSQIDVLLNTAIDIAEDDDVIDFTQDVRRRMVKSITKEGTVMPEDAKEAYVLLTTLDQMSKTALAKKKLEQKAKQGDEDRKAAILVAAMREQTNGRNPFAVAEGSTPAPRREIPVITEEDGEHNFPTTAMERGLAQERFSEFSVRMAPIIDARRRSEEEAMAAEEAAQPVEEDENFDDPAE